MQVEKISSTSVEVLWSEPVRKNGALLYYEVTVTGSDGYNDTVRVLDLALSLQLFELS